MIVLITQWTTANNIVRCIEIEWIKWTNEQANGSIFISNIFRNSVHEAEDKYDRVTIANAVNCSEGWYWYTIWATSEFGTRTKDQLGHIGYSYFIILLYTYSDHEDHDNNANAPTDYSENQLNVTWQRNKSNNDSELVFCFEFQLYIRHDLRYFRQPTVGERSDRSVFTGANTQAYELHVQT